MKLISIIVPFFNSSLTIKHTLKSISNQSFKDFECILIDDGSFDKSRSIALPLKCFLFKLGIKDRRRVFV